MYMNGLQAGAVFEENYPVSNTNDHLQPTPVFPATILGMPSKQVIIGAVILAVLVYLLNNRKG